MKLLQIINEWSLIQQTNKTNKELKRKKHTHTQQNKEIEMQFLNYSVNFMFSENKSQFEHVNTKNVWFDWFSRGLMWM